MARKHGESAASDAALFAVTEGPWRWDPREGVIIVLNDAVGDA